MKSLTSLLLVLMLAVVSCSGAKTRPVSFEGLEPKRFDLVLVHGLSNKHKWGEDFLDACLRVWGSGNVYVVYTNDSDRIWTRTLDGRDLICAGEDDGSAGTRSIAVQTANVARALDRLEKDHGLSRPFSIIAHSMGGLVSRSYIADHPGRVADLVTLGTPHHGSPLADSFDWVGRFLGAREAIDDLKPARVKEFNRACPVAEARLFEGGRIYTIRGRCPNGGCFGWGGELHLGWNILRTVYDTDSDGMVPSDSAVIEGAPHLADFPDFDHYELVQEPSVLLAAAARLR